MCVSAEVLNNDVKLHNSFVRACENLAPVVGELEQQVAANQSAKAGSVQCVTRQSNSGMQKLVASSRL